MQRTAFGEEFLESESASVYGSMRASYIVHDGENCTVWTWYKGEWVLTSYPA